MARFFVGSAEEFESQVFAPVHDGTVEYLRNQAQKLTSGWGDALTEAAQLYVARAEETFDRFYSSDALAKARSAMRKVKGVFAKNVISTMSTIEDFQQAQPRNQRYVMAHVGLRKLYHEQMVDGYSDEYIDLQPGAIGHEHRDWRRIHDGDVFENEEGELERHRYVEMTDEEEAPVPLDEKMITKDNFTMLDYYLATSDRDPCSKSGGRR